MTDNEVRLRKRPFPEAVARVLGLPPDSSLDELLGEIAFLRFTVGSVSRTGDTMVQMPTETWIEVGNRFAQLRTHMERLHAALDDAHTALMNTRIYTGETQPFVLGPLEEAIDKASAVLGEYLPGHRWDHPKKGD